MKYLGIDFGLKKVGLAVGDNESHLAVPYGNVPGGTDIVARVVDLAKSEGIDGFVIGVPLPTSPHQSEEQLERTIAFIRALAEASGLPVEVVDEGFTSAEARRVQKEYGASATEDSLAAMLILQAFLDEQIRVQR